MTEEEKQFIGSWTFEISPSKNGNKNFSYLKLNENRKGTNGILVNSNGKTFLGTSFDVFDWKIRNDTLIVDYMMKGGLFSSPGRKDTVINDYPVRDYWIIKQKLEREFVAESFDPTIPSSSEVRFVRNDEIQ